MYPTTTLLARRGSRAPLAIRITLQPAPAGLVYRGVAIRVTLDSRAPPDLRAAPSWEARGPDAIRQFESRSGRRFARAARAFGRAGDLRLFGEHDRDSLRIVPRPRGTHSGTGTDEPANGRSAPTALHPDARLDRVWRLPGDGVRPRPDDGGRPAARARRPVRRLRHRG